MNFKQIAVVAALALSSTGALADIFNVNVINGTASFNHSNVVAGEFQDVWNFNIAGLVTADGILSNFSFRPNQDIDFGVVTLNGVELTVTNTVDAGGNLSLAKLFPANFVGPLQLVVNFTSGGNGSYSGNINVTAVPEPETYALMLAGLGLVGFMARRRKAAV